MSRPRRHRCRQGDAVKRETKAWLKLVMRDDMDKRDHPARDVLDSDARQRAEIRDLRARLKVIAAAPVSVVVVTAADNDAADVAFRALDLKNKNWMKP